VLLEVKAPSWTGFGVLICFKARSHRQQEDTHILRYCKIFNMICNAMFRTYQHWVHCPMASQLLQSPAGNGLKSPPIVCRGRLSFREMLMVLLSSPTALTRQGHKQGLLSTSGVMIPYRPDKKPVQPAEIE
jgi:hypothetical protein